MQAPSDTKPRWERRKDARPQELLEAALAQFVERGFAATRLEDVARRAGVSKGTLYLYFENKQELFKAVVRGTIVQAIGDAEQEIANYAGPSADLFRVIMMRWWDKIGDTKLAGITKLMMAEATNFPDLAAFYNEEVVVRGNGLLCSVLRRGMASGEFRTIDTAVMTRVLTAPVVMLMMWAHAFLPCDMPDLDPEQYMAAFLDVSLRGLLADPAPAA
ncbi:TetR/AcrR family transcriptional regulator [Oxalobacteraceae bacterium A2-2]